MFPSSTVGSSVDRTVRVDGCPLAVHDQAKCGVHLLHTLSSARTSTLLEAVDAVSEANHGKHRLTEHEVNRIKSLLMTSDDEEEDQVILTVLGRRTLTDDERERVRHLLALMLMERGISADGSLNEDGRAIDEIIGKVMFY